MRVALAVFACLPIVACAEAVQGPRVVGYGESRFDVRHLTWRESRSEIGDLADEICRSSGRYAVLEFSQQYAALDIRSATYRCVPASPAPSSEVPADVGGA